MDPLVEKLQKLQSDYFKRRRLLFILDLISLFAILYAASFILSAEFFLKDSSFLPRSIPANIILQIITFIMAISGAFLLHKNDRNIKFNYLVEDKYPELREKLRTAYDNITESNVIIESLKSLVFSSLTLVSAAKLIKASAVIAKIIVVIIFVSGAYVISSNPEYRIPPDTIAGSVKNLTGIGSDQINLTGDIDTFSENIDNIGSNGSGSILGKPHIASIEGKNIDLTLYTGQDSGYEIRDTAQTNNQFIASAQFPVDALGSNVSDGGYSMLLKKTEAEKQLINKYALQRSKI